MANVTKCHLHVPHKRWHDTDDEEQNYLAIERWSRDYLRRYIADHSTRLTPLLIPNKSYADSPPEAENYHAVEHWVYQQVPASLGVTKTSLSRYDLVIPHKEWALDMPNGDLERENYTEIERWARRFIRTCLPIGSG